MANTKLSGHLVHHGKSVLLIGIISAVGIIAAFGFQIITARYLGPTDFGILAAFFACINIAATGSSSLQNSVAVQSARNISSGRTSKEKAIVKLDGYMIEALTLGVAGALIVLASSVWLDQGLATNPLVPWIAAISIILSFIFARALGTIQGSGASLSTVWWSTLSLLIRLALVAFCFLLGLGLTAVLIAVLIGNIASAMGATLRSRNLNVNLGRKAFQKDGLIVLFLSVVIALATNIDVILVRALTASDFAGTYAAAAVLVKAAFMVPATLSLYLLPRFVKQENNSNLTRLGTQATLGLTFATSLGMLIVFGFWGSTIGGILYGDQYNFSNGLLPLLTLAFMPWALTQALLIRITALSSGLGLIILSTITGLLVVLIFVTLPDVLLMLTSVGVSGVLALLSFWIIDIDAHKKLQRAQQVQE